MADESINEAGKWKVQGGRLKRSVPIVALAARSARESVVRKLRKGDEEALRQSHERVAKMYAEHLGQSKGVLMKVGQLASFLNLGGMIPEGYEDIYQSALASLQSQAPPMDFDAVEAAVRTELGQPISKLFKEFSPVALAAASIGQVHAATTIDGKRVAVKVQYPGVADAIHDDLKNTESVANALKFAQSMSPGTTRLDIDVATKEISERIVEELDYENEAENQRYFAERYEGHRYIHIPKVFAELSSKKVLTMELVEGIKFQDAIRYPQETRNIWGEAIWRFVFGSFYRVFAFNADPHPGNYLFHPDGRVTFLDFGCVKYFTKTDIDQLKNIVMSVHEGDPQKLFDAFAVAGFIDPNDAPTPQEVYDWYSFGFGPVLTDEPFRYTPEFAHELVQREFDVTNEWGRVSSKFSLPKAYVFLTRINLGLASIMGDMGSEARWGAIDAERLFGAPPATEMGKYDLEFFGPQSWAGK